METPSSTWIFESDAPLEGCGIDVERIERFGKFAGGADRPWQFVFSDEEADHALRMPDPAAALCAAFCVKEAFRKALGRQYDYTGCELLLEPSSETQIIRLGGDLAREHGISGTRALVRQGDDGTMTAIVYVFGEDP